jgi:hypothetical protein
MKRLFGAPVVVASLIVNLAATVVFAQSEKISPRIAPKPNQTIRITMVQEMDMDISIDAVGPVPPAIGGPLRMTMRTTSSMTQKTGAMRPDGSYDAEVRYDEMRSDMTMNGQSVATGAATNQLVGKVITVTYDRSGQLIESKFPPDFPGSAEIVKQLMVSLSGNLPDASMGIGDVASIPLDLTLPIPIPGGSGMKVDGQTEMKLVSIDQDGKGRSARFDSVTYGKMVSSVKPDGKTSVSIDLTVTGTGATVMDLDAGFIRSAESNTTFDAKMLPSPGSSPAGMPSMIMKGTMKIALTGSN